MAVRLLRAQTFNGVTYPAFDVLLGLSSDIEARLKQGGDAVPVNLQVVNAGGAVTPGEWISLGAGAMPMLRLRMAGNGTVTMNARDRDLVVTNSVYTATVSGTPFVEYAYPGDDATEFQIVLTGTATAEVI